MIVAAAIRRKGKNYALPAPARHADIMRRWDVGRDGDHVQGFIDSEHGFVDRRDAALIANREGQRLDTDHHQIAHVLFSEDVW